MALPAPSDGPPPIVVRSDEVHSVTSAQTGLSQEQRARTRRYLISMAIRTACFLAAVFASGWLRWAFLAGAVFLPYVAVVMANAGRENDNFDGPAPITPTPIGQLPAAPAGADEERS
jgi:hypothetical protein